MRILIAALLSVVACGRDLRLPSPDPCATENLCPGASGVDDRVVGTILFRTCFCPIPPLPNALTFAVHDQDGAWCADVRRAWEEKCPP